MTPPRRRFGILEAVFIALAIAYIAYAIFVFSQRQQQIVLEERVVERVAIEVSATPASTRITLEPVPTQTALTLSQHQNAYRTTPTSGCGWVISTGQQTARRQHAPHINNTSHSPGMMPMKAPAIISGARKHQRPRVGRTAAAQLL